MKLHIRRCSELTRSMKTRYEEDRTGVHQVGVHQSLVLMSNIVLGVLPLRISKWLSFVLAKDLAILADTIDELLFKLNEWKTIGKQRKKCEYCRDQNYDQWKNLHSLRNSEQHPYKVWRKSVGSNSIFRVGRQPLQHMKCSGMKGKLIADPTYRYTRCIGLCTTVDWRSEKHAWLDHHKYNKNTPIRQSFKPF